MTSRLNSRQFCRSHSASPSAMAVDIELPSRNSEATDDTGRHHDESRHPFQTQGEASSSSLPQKPPGSYSPYGPPPPHPSTVGWGPQQQQQPPRQVDFRTIPSIPPDIRSRTLFGLHNGEPRPPLLLVAIILRPVLLLIGMAFIAMVIVLNQNFGLLYWGWLAAGIASLLASLTAISIPLLAYKRRRARLCLQCWMPRPLCFLPSQPFRGCSWSWRPANTFTSMIFGGIRRRAIWSTVAI